MPIYEYECKKCGHHMEVFQKFSDAPLTKCGQCHGKLRKLISQNAFHLKGTGWYVTDYASSKGNSRSVKEKDSSSKEAKKTDTKPSTEKPSSKSSDE